MKKQLIMEKALELFAEQGFEATSVKQITDICGISKGAFYLSFKSKDELILALIDHFMEQITSNIDYVVTNSNDESVLHAFYYEIFTSFHKHSDFAKLLMKEQTQSFNDVFLIKMRYYDQLMDKTILNMIERLYGENVEKTKYDLIFCVKGLMHVYSTLFLFNNVPLDVNVLAKTLVEKTNLLAQHTNTPFISKELMETFGQPMSEEMSADQLIDVINQKIEEMEESIEKESLTLLKQELIEPTLGQAIVKGLIENIRNHPHCKWIAFLLRNHFKV